MGTLKDMYTSVGILMNADGNVLVDRRPEDKENYPGYWEFPGGRQDNDETPPEVLKRELMEELGVDVDPANLTELGVINHEYPELEGGINVVCTIFLCRAWQGQPQALEGQAAIEFVPPKGLLDRKMIPGDVPRVALLLKHLGLES